MQTTKVLLTFFVIFAAFACNKNRSVLLENKQLSADLVTYAYAQTQCADPWPASTDDNVTAQNVRRYLDSAGVPVSSVNIKKTALEASCLACTCPSGKIIYVTTPNTQVVKARIRELKFN
ncbi:hypothetical protein [Paracnuella aquatica]|uniref:hypothetical protein n=1 Tax=Paracnuella aquatica TaxID=2268757 RepID=UPI000DEF34A5|nr:hypothetical protein [Paracnuella aquatica]RPD50698.1 hypothetical protein DRJ53_07195 [Paracnuella aquatica]